VKCFASVACLIQYLESEGLPRLVGASCLDTHSLEMLTILPICPAPFLTTISFAVRIGTTPAMWQSMGNPCTFLAARGISPFLEPIAPRVYKYTPCLQSDVAEFHGVRLMAEWGIEGAMERNPHKGVVSHGGLGVSIVVVVSVEGLRFCPPLSVQRKCPHAGDADIEQEGADAIADTERG
jgi:hypothetical protein